MTVAGRTIREAVALALEAIPGSATEWAWHRDEREAIRVNVVTWVRDYAERRGVILTDDDISSEFAAIVRDLRRSTRAAIVRDLRRST